MISAFTTTRGASEERTPTLSGSALSLVLEAFGAPPGTSEKR